MSIITSKTLPRVALPPLSRFERATNIATALIFVVMCVCVLQAWQTLPDVIPIHFTAGGTVDGEGTKHTLWIMPIFNGLILLSTHIVMARPWLANYGGIPITEANAADVYRLARQLMLVIGLITTSLLTLLTVSMVRCARSEVTEMSMWPVWTCLGLLFIVIVFYFVMIARRAARAD